MSQMFIQLGFGICSHTNFRQLHWGAECILDQGANRKEVTIKMFRLNAVSLYYMYVRVMISKPCIMC